MPVQIWKDESDRFSRLLEDGVEVACIDRSYGRWRGSIEQSIVPNRTKATRRTVGGTAGYDTREKAKIAVEDAIHNVRHPNPALAASDAAALSREALAVCLEPEEYEMQKLTAFDVLNHVGVWK